MTWAVSPFGKGKASRPYPTCCKDQQNHQWQNLPLSIQNAKTISWIQQENKLFHSPFLTTKCDDSGEVTASSNPRSENVAKQDEIIQNLSGGTARDSGTTVRGQLNDFKTKIASNPVLMPSQQKLYQDWAYINQAQDTFPWFINYVIKRKNFDSFIQITAVWLLAWSWAKLRSLRVLPYVPLPQFPCNNMFW